MGILYFLLLCFIFNEGYKKRFVFQKIIEFYSIFTFLCQANIPYYTFYPCGAISAFPQ